VREALDVLHHVTAVCSDAARTVDFYRAIGLHLVKKTVNFDDPGSYHLYFGDELGRPGTLLTFFEWPHAGRGHLGTGAVASVAVSTPAVGAPREVEDPDGLHLELYPGEQAELLWVTAFGEPSLYEGLLAERSQLRFAYGAARHAVIGIGSVHHIAWRMADAEEQLAWRERVAAMGLRPTPALDRKYFESVYFRTRDGILFELATDPPGFTVDEPPEALGAALALPEWLEPERATIERILTPIS
jgi:glyoxalase family protein